MLPALRHALTGEFIRLAAIAFSIDKQFCGKAVCIGNQGINLSIRKRKIQMGEKVQHRLVLFPQRLIKIIAILFKAAAV